MKLTILIPPSKHAKNVARDLVYGCWCKGKRIAGIQFPPMSLISLATVLKNSSIKVDLLDAAAHQMTLADIIPKFKDSGMVVILTSTMTLNEDASILSAIKQVYPEIVSVVFGGHVTAEPRSSLTREGIDLVVRREAEYILRDLLLALNDGKEEWKKVKGISFIEDGAYRHNPDYPLIGDLDELPIPDRRMLPEGIDYFNPIVKRLPYTTMFTSRGCPGLCTFCSSPRFYGRTLRFRSAEAVLLELEDIVRLGYKEVFFRDEIFTSKKSRVLKICDGIIQKGLDITWICSARIGTVDLEMMKVMKKSGCHMLRLGVESGVQKLLDGVKKGITLEKIRNTLKWAHETGLDVHAHMMIGLPGETVQTLEETIRFVKNIDPTIVTFGIMTPYPGTPLYDDLITKIPDLGDGTAMDISRLHTHSFFNENFTKLRPEELQNYIRKVYRSFYMRPSYMLKWLKRINSLDEFKRISLAGAQVLDFIMGTD